MVSAGFNFTIIKSFIPTFYAEAMVLSEMLRKKSDSKSNECDISVPISMATMEMIGRTAMGVKFNAQHGSGHRFVENVLTAMRVSDFCYRRPNKVFYLQSASRTFTL